MEKESIYLAQDSSCRLEMWNVSRDKVNSEVSRIYLHVARGKREETTPVSLGYWYDLLTIVLNSGEGNMSDPLGCVDARLRVDMLPGEIGCLSSFGVK